MPERIYINPNPEHRTWLIGKGDISFIEYVKEDAFIDKAVSYILSHKPDMHILGNSGVMDELIVKDFVNYMKGE